MSSELMLYVILGIMLLVALLGVLPPLIKGASKKDVESDAVHQRELSEALQEERHQLDMDLERGLLDQDRYDQMLEDLKRRALEETTFITNGPKVNFTFGVSPWIVIAVMALMIAASVGIYTAVGAPELQRLAQDQKVIEGQADIPALKTYLEDNKRDGRAWVLLARKYIEKEDWQNAADAYRQGRANMTKVREDVAVTMELVATLLQIGTPEAYQEAYPLIKEAYLAQPTNPKVNELMAMASIATQHWADAQRSMEKLLEGIDTSDPNYLRYFDTYQAVKQRAEQAAALQTSEAK